MKSILRALLFLILVLASQTALAKWRTPYHSIDEGDYKGVIQALGSPAKQDRTVMRIATYARYNFKNVEDKTAFGKIDYWQSSQEMFSRKYGDCEDWAAFMSAALKGHNIEAETWYTNSRELDWAHIFVLAPYKGGWTYLDNNQETIHGSFSSKETITSKFWERFTGNRTDGSRLVRLPQSASEPRFSKLLVSSSRLSMHRHLTESKPNRIEVVIPMTEKEKDYSKLQNKEAIGFLAKTTFLKTKAMGFSYSEHGWYSPSREFNDKMYTFHVLFPHVGVSAYTGDYQGVDIDVNPVNLRWLRVYVNARNFGEVWDYKTVLLPSKYFEGQAEYNDRYFNYSFYLTTFDRRLDGSLKLGWNSAKELKAVVRSGKKEFEFSFGQDYKFSMSFGW